MKSKLSEFITSHSENIVIVVQGLGFVSSVISIVCAISIHNQYAVIIGETGFLFPLNDNKVFASHILDLLDDQDKMKRMGLAGRDYVIKNFSSNIIIPQIVDIIEGSLIPLEKNKLQG